MYYDLDEPIPAVTHDILRQIGSCRAFVEYMEDDDITEPSFESLVTEKDAGVEPAAPKISLVPRKGQEALEKKLKKMSRHEQNLLILKKFLKVSQEQKGGYDGVFFATSFPLRTHVRRVEKLVKKMATTLAMVSLKEWILDGSTYLGMEVRNSNVNGAFEETTFKNVAMFILHAFDVEDLERFNCYHKLKAEYAKFYNENLLHLKRENPYKLVAERKINLDGFPLLREQDVGHILRTHVDGCGAFHHMAALVEFGWKSNIFCCFKESCHSHFVEMARTVLLQYVPMEKDMKMYSNLGCGRTLDAIRDEDLSKIDQILESGKCDEIGVLSFKLFMADMIEGRYYTLKDLSFSVTYGLRFGKFGSFAKEVFDLVDIAEVRRRSLSHRFISKHHILWAVRLTEFKDFVDRLVEGIGLRDLVEKPATCPPYSVYISASSTAKIHGVEVVGVEHIVVATIFEMSERRLRKDLYEFNDIHCIKEFLDAARDYKKKSDHQEHLDNDRSPDIALNTEDDECDVDTYLVDYYLEYVNKNKIKNLRRSKKYKNYKWSGSIRVLRDCFVF